VPAPADLQALIDQGWALIPVKGGSKRPEATDWTVRTFGVSDFAPDDNVGVKLGTVSNGLVDVDCDTNDAAALALELLPVTLMHGRASRPNSHYWYYCDPVPESTQVWKDLKNSTLLELRSTGGQTVIPPSTHASGEAIVWSNYGQRPLKVEHPVLVQNLKIVAVGALLVQHWPTGRRHEAAGHIGGMLARFDLAPAMIERLIRGVARLAGDDEVEDRARFARESAERHARGENTTGAPSLKEMFGEAGALIVARIAQWFGQEDLDLIEQLNERHFVVQLGSSMVVGTEPQRPGEAVEFQKFEDFDKKYFNRYLGKKKLGKAWLEHPARRTYDRVVFAPPHSDVFVGPDDYNIWRGFVCAPYEGAKPDALIPRYLDHVHHVIAGGDQAKADYVLDLLADCVQRPGDPPGKALVLRSQQGRGKSLLIETFGRLFGRHFLSVNQRSQLTGNFNSHLSGRVVVFADDAVWGGHKEDVGTIKYLTTQRRFMIERKHVDSCVEDNFMHLFLATNESWAWPAGNRERRGVVYDIDVERPRSYFDALVAEIKQPTFQPALLAYLMARTVDLRRLRDGLETEALREQQDLSVDPVQQWWKQVLDDGAWKGDAWPEFVTTDALYEQFTEEMGSQRGAGASHRGTRASVVKRVHTMLPPTGTTVFQKLVRENVFAGIRGAAPEWVEKRRRCLPLPPLAACRRAYDLYTGLSHEWPPVYEEAEQLTMEEL